MYNRAQNIYNDITKQPPVTPQQQGKSAKTQVPSVTVNLSNVSSGWLVSELKHQYSASHSCHIYSYLPKPTWTGWKCGGTGFCTGSLNTIIKVVRQGTICTVQSTVPLHVVPSSQRVYMATYRTLQDTNGIQPITTTKGLGSLHTITGMFTTICNSTSFSQPDQYPATDNMHYRGMD
jgi:hypothetical protein